jgi:hypothetical protein
VNFGELQGYTRERTGTVNNDVISDRELARMLNLALGNLHQLLVNEYEDYEITTFLASLRGGPGNNFIPLPTDFLKLRAVDYGSQNQWVTLYGFGLQERNRYSNPIISMFVPYLGGAARAVRVMGQGIYIEPAIVSSGQYQVWYTPKFQDLENSDPLPIHMDTEGWVEYAVASAGVKIYTKLLLPPDAFLADRAYYQELVLTGAANRMSQGPKVMTNVRNVNDTIYPNGQGGFGGAGW